MEALLAAELPNGAGWQYEPKWDGFHCLASRDGGEVELTSKSGKPLGRYFPEVVAMLEGLKEKQFLLDGELIIPLGDALSFEALQLRLHPAESRIRKLSKQTPAEFMLFDLLAIGGKSLAGRPLSERRKQLERFHAKQRVPGLLLSPATTDHKAALGWLERMPTYKDQIEKLVAELNRRAGAYGIGRIDMIENRAVGIKSREVYEAPAAIVLIQAHSALEDVVLTKDEARIKRGLEQRWTELVYEGLWFSPLREAIDARRAPTTVLPVTPPPRPGDAVDGHLGTRRHERGLLRAAGEAGSCTGRRSARPARLSTISGATSAREAAKSI